MKIEKLKAEIHKEIKDQRRQYGNKLHELEDIIIIPVYVKGEIYYDKIGN